MFWLARRDVVGRQRNGPTEFHPGKVAKNSQVRLANNTTNNSEVADCMPPR